MSTTSVLPFVRGIDFSRNDFQVRSLKNLYKIGADF